MIEVTAETMLAYMQAKQDGFNTGLHNKPPRQMYDYPAEYRGAYLKGYNEGLREYLFREAQQARGSN